MKTISSFEGVVREVASIRQRGKDPFVRWTSSPEKDKKGGYISRNHQTGQAEPGLSVNGLNPPAVLFANVPKEIAARQYIAQQLTEYSVLLTGSPYIVTGRKVGRGSDNEPVIDQVEFVAKVSERAVREAKQEEDRLKGMNFEDKVRARRLEEKQDEDRGRCLKWWEKVLGCQ